MRWTSYFITLLLAITAHAELMIATSLGPRVTELTSSALNSRLEGVRRFSTGSNSPNQRDVLAESNLVSGERGMIYYSSLTLDTNPISIENMADNEPNGLTDPGNVDVVTGGMVGPASGTQAAATAHAPSPGAASLALIGVLLCSSYRRPLKQQQHGQKEFSE